MLIAKDSEVNKAERFPKEITQTQVAQLLVLAYYKDQSKVTKCLAALLALEKNQDKVENYVVKCAASASKPKNYKDAITYAEASRWIPSIDKEVKEIITNNVQDVVEPLPGVLILISKFKYKVRTNANREVTIVCAQL